MLVADDIFTLLAVVLFAYILYRERGTISEKMAGTVKGVLEGARKFLTMFFILLVAAFVLGQIYAAMIIGYFPDTEWFWLPFLILFLLLVYYYTG